jgi:hypothetical protein
MKKILTNISKYDAVLRGSDLDTGLDVGEVMWTHDNRLRLLN